jgi:hypothetical protein
VAEISGFQAEIAIPGETPVEYQRAGWQAILDNFARHVMAR